MNESDKSKNVTDQSDPSDHSSHHEESEKSDKAHNEGYLDELDWKMKKRNWLFTVHYVD